MSDYECTICGSTFKDITHLQIHITSKKGCEKHLNKKFECLYCDGKYTTKRAKEYHEEYRCSKRKNLDETQENKNIDIVKLQEQLEKQQKEINELKNSNKKGPGRPKKITTNSHNNTNTNTNTNTIHSNNTNTNNSNNNNMYQVNYISFGNENLERLSKKDKYEIGCSSYGSIKLLTKHVHCNPNIPDQRNVYITNMKSDLGYIIVDDKLIANDVDEILEDILLYRRGDLETILNDERIKISPKHRERCLDLLEKIKNGDEKQIKMVKNELKLLIYNENKMNKEIKKLK
jgi:hypothetical protein